MWGPILGAIGALGGKLFDRSEARRQERKAAAFNPVKKRVEDARAAGVHPIYALGASGLDSASTGSQVAFGETLGNMGQNIGSSIDKSLDVHGKQAKSLLLEKAGLENELLRTQIAKARTDMVKEPTLPALGQRYLLEGQGSTALSHIPGSLVEVPGAHKLQSPQYTPNLVFGGHYRTHPRFSDAQTYEDRYGEAMGSLLGVINTIADMQWAGRQWAGPHVQKEIFDKLRK